MKLLLDNIDSAVANKLWVLALHGSLAVPDICGALDSANGHATGAKYKAWFDQNLGALYRGTVGPRPGTPIVYLDGDAAYRFRCSLLHQGTTAHPQSPYSRIVFAVAAHVTIHKAVMNDVLAIDVATFCSDMTNAARSWLAANTANITVQNNIASGVDYHPTGFGGIGGIPVIG